MIPPTFHLKNYQQIPILTNGDILNLYQKQQKLIFYDQLVLDVTKFRHPGNFKIIQPFVNNINANVKASFIAFNHSEYAYMLLCLRVIGKTQNKPKQEFSNSQFSAQKIYRKMLSSQRFKTHQQIFSKVDFSKPLYDQLQGLNAQQKYILTETPTDLWITDKITFKSTPFQQFGYTNSFWVSTFTFQFAILLYLLNFYNEWGNGQKIFSLIPFFIIGIIKWTLIEYFYHRFLLHWDIKKKPLIGDHLMHHAFPNMQNKIAITAFKVLKYFVGFRLFYSLFMEANQIHALCLGILVGVTLYDIAHYYCHFGPEVNIQWINRLKRNHLKHHFRDSSKGFGVSNTIWDKVFRTEHQLAREK